MLDIILLICVLSRSATTLQKNTIAKFLGSIRRDADAYNNLGTVYERQGKIEAAERLYRQAIRVSPSISTAYYNLARLHYGRGEEVEARAAIERALDLEPENEAFIKLQAEVLGTLGGLSNTTILLVVGGFGGIMGVYTILYLKGKVVG